MELISVKIIALTLLGVLSLFFGLLPIKVRGLLGERSGGTEGQNKAARRRRELVISALLCFGAGVLLATVFIHMLPETRENFAGAACRGLIEETEYPLAELVICAGFFLIYLVEELVHKVFLTRDTRLERKLTKVAAAIEEETANGLPPGHTRPAHITSSQEGTKPRSSVYTVTGSSTTTPSAPSNAVCTAANPSAAPLALGTMSSKSKWSETGIDNPVFAGDVAATAWNPSVKEQVQALPSGATPTHALDSETASDASNKYPQQLQQPHHHHHHHHHHHGHGHSHQAGISKLGSKGLASNLRSLLVILALSFHAVFEGMAVGLQETSMDVWYLFGAIAAHKLVIAFCVGLELLTAGTARSLVVIYMVVFALVSPLGVGIGIIVTENGDAGSGANTLAITALQGLAGGTILYVTFFEVLERERGKPSHRLIKLFFVIVGFMAMAGMEAGSGHSHEHSCIRGSHGHGAHGDHDHGAHGDHDHGFHGGHDHDHHDHHGHHDDHDMHHVDHAHAH